MAYRKNPDPNSQTNNENVKDESVWKKMKKPFLYMGTAAALVIGTVFGYEQLQKSNEEKDTKKEPVLEKVAEPEKQELKKTVADLTQKENATLEQKKAEKETLPKVKTRTVIDYQFAIVQGLASEKVQLEPAVKKELVKQYQLADAAIDSWVASKVQALKGNNKRALEYADVAIRQFPELAKCNTFQDVAFELYKKQMAAGIDTSHARAKLAYTSLTKAERFSNPEKRLKYIYKAVVLAPPVGIMAGNLSAAEKIAFSYKGGNHVMLRAQKIEVPVAQKTNSAVMAHQSEGR